MQYLSKPSEGPAIMIVMPPSSPFSMHPRRKNCYRTSYRNPVAVQPARMYTIKTPAEHRAGTCTTRSQVTSFVISDSLQGRTSGPVQIAAASKSNHRRPETCKSCRGHAGKCLALSFVKLHESYYEMFASVGMNGLSSRTAIPLATTTSQMI